MIQRFVSIVIGALVTFLLLLLFHNGRIISDEITGFLVSVVVGALVALFWPLIWSTSMARRTRERREAAMRVEVQRQLESERPVDVEQPVQE
jgi:4-amino-4-deoxy-L-arabinose transferase-like glycosyltransferase